ncbi:MAG TPA: acyl-CoA dehydrogenase family protein, partial [Thermomonospora sp.]|nr:acyl-CoA dehydrogenase family protein [Thermomonospora sp.]
MAIGLTEEHQALAASVRGLAERHITATVVRDEVDAPRREGRPEFWGRLAEQGLLGLHVPEEFGGQGFGLVEQAVVAEELGRALAPGPYLPTVLAAAAVAAFAGDATKAEVLPSLADGSRTAAVALRGDLTVTDGGTLQGTATTVLGAPLADLFVLPLGEDRWALVDAADVTVTEAESLDLTRPVGDVTVDGVTFTEFAGPVGDLAVVLFGAEACGVAGRVLDDAVAYAKIREQFGRPIGQFQGVK